MHTVYWTVFILNFICDFQIYKMADNNFLVQNVKFYKFWKNTLLLSIVRNKQWDRFSLDITRKFSYIKDGESNEAYSAPILI